MTVNINDVLEDNTLLGLTLLDKLRVDVLSEARKLVSTACSLTVPLTLRFSGKTGLFFLLSELGGLVTPLVMSLDRIFVLLRKVCHVLFEHFGGDLLMSVQLLEVGLSL